MKPLASTDQMRVDLEHRLARSEALQDEERATRTPSEKRVTKRTIIGPAPAEIDRVAIEVYRIEFQGIKALGYKPREGTVLHNIWKSEKLELRQQKAWKRFVADLHEAAGESGKVTGSYEQAVQVSGNRDWQAWTNREYDRVVRLCDEYLDRQKERPLLVALIMDELQKPGVLQLERIGLHFNGYRDGAQARSAGIANVCYLMNRIASFYGI